MATASEILNSPDYQNANEETKQAIFDKHIANTPEYQGANEKTREAIHQRFGLPSKPSPSGEDLPDSYSSKKSFEDTATDFYAKKGEPSTTEQIFGRGLGPEATFKERLGKLTESTLTGMGIGTLIEPGGGTAAGAVAGFTGEAIEQTLGALGLPRGAQVAGGVVTPLAAGKVLSEGTKLGLTALDLLNPKKIFGKVAKSIGAGEETPEVKAFRDAEVQKAKNQLLGPTSFLDNQKIGADVLENVRARQARAERLARQAEQTRGTVQSDLLRQQNKAENEYSRTLLQGPGQSQSDYNLGTSLRNEVFGIQDPIYKEMASSYDAAYKTSMEAAEKSERSGNYWAKTNEAKAIREKWLDIAKNSSAPIAKEIKDIVNDIWKQTTTTKDMWGRTTGYKENFLPASGIDQIIRKLGDAGYKDVEGYQAIKGNLAKELRKDLTLGIDGQGGFYSWSGLGEGKSKYAASLESLSSFESTRGKATLGMQQGVDLNTVDAEKLPKMLLGSESGFRELSTMLGSPEAAQKYAKQYARNELVGKDAKQSYLWAKQHEFLGPEATQIAYDHANKLSRLENNALVLDGMRTDTSVKPWSDNVDKAARRYISELGLSEGGLNTDPSQVIKKVLSGDAAASQVKALTYYLSKNPEIEKRLPAAVADYMATKSPSTMMEEWSRKVRPALEGSGLMKEDLQRIETGLQKIVDASKARPAEKTFKENAKNYLIESFGKAAVKKGAKKTARQIGTSAISGQTFDMLDNLLSSDTKK